MHDNGISDFSKDTHPFNSAAEYMWLKSREVINQDAC
jgi:hypothetical protein